MTKTELVALAKRTASEFDLEPSLLCALVETESGWYPWASRLEEAFKKRYIDPIKSVQRFGSTSYKTERMDRSTSYGLCQVMGQVAREMGCEVRSLTELCNPEVGLKYGAMRLKKAMDRKGGDVRAALLNYNGGSEKKYPDLVMGRMKNYA